MNNSGLYMYNLYLNCIEIIKQKKNVSKTRCLHDKFVFTLLVYNIQLNTIFSVIFQLLINL